MGLIFWRLAINPGVWICGGLKPCAVEGLRHSPHAKAWGCVFEATSQTPAFGSKSIK